MTTQLNDSGVTFADGTIQPSAAQPQLISITGTVASNALTITLAACSLAFRSATLTSGTPSYVATTDLTLTVPSGATLGTVNAVQSRIVVLALNNAGTMELAVVNIAGGNDLSETGVISTTAMSAASDSNNVIYSTTARTNVAYRVVGYVESTQATAGTWATAPSTVQGNGGQALAAMSSLGYGQTWQNVTGSRALGTTYYNTTGKPILVSATPQATTNGTSNLVVNGIEASRSVPAANLGIAVTSIVPPGGSYVVDNNQAGKSLLVWAELR